MGGGGGGGEEEKGGERELGREGERESGRVSGFSWYTGPERTKKGILFGKKETYKQNCLSSRSILPISNLTQKKKEKEKRFPPPPPPPPPLNATKHRILN